jgi:hypothetical protein
MGKSIPPGKVDQNKRVVSSSQSFSGDYQLMIHRVLLLEVEGEGSTSYKQFGEREKKMRNLPSVENLEKKRFHQASEEVAFLGKLCVQLSYKERKT